jgi:hypothetical protein
MCAVILVGKPEGRRQLARPTGGWKHNNNKINLGDVVCEGVGYITLAQEMLKCWALVNMLYNFRVP